MTDEELLAVFRVAMNIVSSADSWVPVLARDKARDSQLCNDIWSVAIRIAADPNWGKSNDD